MQGLHEGRSRETPGPSEERQDQGLPLSGLYEIRPRVFQSPRPQASHTPPRDEKGEAVQSRESGEQTADRRVGEYSLQTGSSVARRLRSSGEQILQLPAMQEEVHERDQAEGSHELPRKVDGQERMRPVRGVLEGRGGASGAHEAAHGTPVGRAIGAGQGGVGEGAGREGGRLSVGGDVAPAQESSASSPIGQTERIEDPLRLLLEDLQNQVDAELARCGARRSVPVRLQPMREEIRPEEPLRGARAVARGREAVRLRAVRENVQGAEAQAGAHQEEAPVQSERDTESVGQHQPLRLRGAARRSDQVHAPDAGQLLRLSLKITSDCIFPLTPKLWDETPIFMIIEPGARMDQTNKFLTSITVTVLGLITRGCCEPKPAFRQSESGHLNVSLGLQVALRYRENTVYPESKITRYYAEMAIY